MIVVAQNRFIAVAVFAHDSSSNLAQPDSVSPSGSGEKERSWYAVGNVFFVHYECAAVQMGVAKGTSYFQFLSYSIRPLAANNLQFAYSSALSTFYRN